ncbi:MAG: winged helix-turn-helix domain-containing protein [Kiritimatiellia bacterium]
MKNEKHTWTFLSNHSHVLICLAKDPEVRMREVAERVGITERAVQRIVGELVGGGVLRLEKVGRRNRYTLVEDLPLRHPLEAHHTVKDLIHAVR